MDNNTQPIPTVTPESPATPPAEFRGTTLQLIGWRLLGFFLTLITLGIGASWAHCMVLRWETKHTYIDGQRLYFDGTGLQLLGKYLLWGLLTLVTFGIYAIFLPVRMRKWRVSHTRFAEDGDNMSGPSGGMIFGIVMAVIAVALLALLAATHLHTTETPIQNPINPDGNYFFIDGEYPTGEGEASYIVNNGDGTFTIIFGNPSNATETQIDATENQTDATHSSASTQPQYSFTDDPRIVNGWLFRAILSEIGELQAGELQLSADGTFSYFSDIFSHNSTEGWWPDGLADSYYKGTYTFYDGLLTLHYTEYFDHPYSSEPGQWVSIDRVVTQTITFSEDDYAIYFSDISSVFHHNGYFDPIAYCPRMTGSIGDMLDAIYPNGIR